jgi:hypothetical protein
MSAQPHQKPPHQQQQQQPPQFLCVFKYFISAPSKACFSTCIFENLTVSNDRSSFIVTTKSKNGTVITRHEKVTGVILINCNLLTFPATINVSFPAIRLLMIHRSSVNSLTRANFATLTTLVELHVTNNRQLLSLNDDVFRDLAELQVLTLEHNNLHAIGPNLLDHLPQLRYVNFDGNPCMTGCYDSINRSGSFATLREVKSELIIRHQQRQIERLQRQGGGPASDIMNAINERRFKDFSVLVGDHEFVVHRVVMASRSRAFGERLADENVRSLALFDVTVPVFRVMLDFMYYEKVPVGVKGDGGDDCSRWSFVDIFEASSRFGLDGLKKYAACKVVECELTRENAVAMLELCGLHESDELRCAAFGEIQKMFPTKILSVEMSRDCEKVKIFIFFPLDVSQL